MRLKLTRILLGTLLFAAPLFVIGCGGSKAEYPKEYAPPPKDKPVSVGGGGGAAKDTNPGQGASVTPAP